MIIPVELPMRLSASVRPTRIERWGTRNINVRSWSLYWDRRLRWLTCRSRLTGCFGSKNRPMTATKMTPTTMTAPPNGVKSNNSNGARPLCASDSLISRLGGVPIRVISPPSKVEYASGISRRDAGIRVRCAIPTTTGNISAATPMLFMKAESTAPVIIMTRIIGISRCPPRRMT